MIEHPYYIYVLIDPRTNAIRYVGITIRPEVRYAQHCHSKEDNIAKRAWVEELAEQGFTPIMNILEIVEGERIAREREKYWMQTYVSQGLSLLNIKDMPNYKRSKECHQPTRKERPSITTANELRKNLLSGHYGPDGKMPSTEQIMKQYSVSINTALMALQFLAGQGLIVRHGQRFYVVTGL